jgi:hypothetical protein
MKWINDMIHNHRERFDTEQPDDGHLERFLQKLDASHGLRANKTKPVLRYSSMQGWYASAAAVVVVLCMSAITFIQFSVKPELELADNNTLHINQLEQYYSSLAEEKIVSIDALAIENKISQSAADDAKGRIQVLLDLSRSLAKEYLRLNHDERVLNAIVQQYMMISSVFELVRSQSEVNNSNLIKLESNEKN